MYMLNGGARRVLAVSRKSPLTQSPPDKALEAFQRGYRHRLYALVHLYSVIYKRAVHGAIVLLHGLWFSPALRPGSAGMDSGRPQVFARG